MLDVFVFSGLQEAHYRARRDPAWFVQALQVNALCMGAAALTAVVWLCLAGLMKDGIEGVAVSSHHQHVSSFSRTQGGVILTWCE